MMSTKWSRRSLRSECLGESWSRSSSRVQSRCLHQGGNLGSLALCGACRSASDQGGNRGYCASAGSTFKNASWHSWWVSSCFWTRRKSRMRQERIVKQEVNTPVPSDKEETAESVQVTPQQRLKERILEQRVSVSVPPNRRKSRKFCSVDTTGAPSGTYCGPERTASQIVNAPSAQGGNRGSCVPITPNERDQTYFVEQITDFPVPLMKEENPGASAFAPGAHPRTCRGENFQ